MQKVNIGGVPASAHVTLLLLENASKFHHRTLGTCISWVFIQRQRGSGTPLEWTLGRKRQAGRLRGRPDTELQCGFLHAVWPSADYLILCLCALIENRMLLLKRLRDRRIRIHERKLSSGYCYMCREWIFHCCVLSVLSVAVMHRVAVGRTWVSVV